MATDSELQSKSESSRSMVVAFSDSVSVCELALGGLWRASIFFLAIVIAFWGIAAFTGHVGPSTRRGFVMVSYMIPGLLAGPVFAMVSTAFAIVIIPAVNCSIGFALSGRAQVAAMGGLTGTIVTAWMLAPMLESTAWEVVLLYCCGSLVAATVGHCFALRYMYRRDDCNYVLSNATKRPLRIGVRHMFSIVIWFAFAYAIAARIHWAIGVVSTLYVVHQAAMIWIDDFCHPADSSSSRRLEKASQ